MISIAPQSYDLSQPLTPVPSKAAIIQGAEARRRIRRARECHAINLSSLGNRSGEAMGLNNPQKMGENFQGFWSKMIHDMGGEQSRKWQHSHIVMFS